MAETDGKEPHVTASNRTAYYQARDVANKLARDIRLMADHLDWFRGIAVVLGVPPDSPADAPSRFYVSVRVQRGSQWPRDLIPPTLDGVMIIVTERDLATKL